jgi:flagellar biogenesis protein FliO
MASKGSADTGLQRIIQEVDDLQLPESAKGYFTEVSKSVFVMSQEADTLQLLKHIDARDQQWAKVVKLWEHYESHSKSFNKAMIEIMQNMQEIFLKDDVFLKHMYKERMEEVGATLKDDSA